MEPTRLVFGASCAGQVSGRAGVGPYALRPAWQPYVQEAWPRRSPRSLLLPRRPVPGTFGDRAPCEGGSWRSGLRFPCPEGPPQRTRVQGHLSPAPGPGRVKREGRRGHLVPSNSPLALNCSPGTGLDRRAAARPRVHLEGCGVARHPRAGVHGEAGPACTQAWGVGVGPPFLRPPLLPPNLARLLGQLVPGRAHSREHRLPGCPPRSPSSVLVGFPGPQWGWEWVGSRRETPKAGCTSRPPTPSLPGSEGVGSPRWARQRGLGAGPGPAAAPQAHVSACVRGSPWRHDQSGCGAASRQMRSREHVWVATWGQS